MLDFVGTRATHNKEQVGILETHIIGQVTIEENQVVIVIIVTIVTVVIMAIIVIIGIDNPCVRTNPHTHNNLMQLTLEVKNGEITNMRRN